MKHKISTLIIALVVGLFVVGPVYAHESTDTTKTETSETDQPKVKERIEVIKLKTAERKAKVKLAVCEKKQANINRHMAHAVTQANKHKGVFDRIFSRVQTFYADKQLTVTNYAELKSTVETKQSEAAAAIDALASYTFTLDCASADAGDKLNSFKEASKAAKTALHEYRKAIVDFTKAIKAVALTKESE